MILVSPFSISRRWIALLVSVGIGFGTMTTNAAPDFSSTGAGQGGPDGLCDVWQQLYGAWGLDPSGDEDLDGFTNLEESIAGTDPFNAADAVRVSHITTSGNSLAVHVKVRQGKRYQLFHSAKLGGGSWSLVPNSTFVSTQEGVAASITTTKPAGGRGFYKIVVTDHDQDNDGVSDWVEHLTGTDPTMATSPSNASGGVATDLETLRSLLSLTAAPVPGEEIAYEVADQSASPTSRVPARIRLVRTYGAMPLTLRVTTTGGAVDETKGNASALDFNIADLDAGRITFPTNAGTPANPHHVVVHPVSDFIPEVPEHLRVTFQPPDATSSVVLASSDIFIADAVPGLEANRTLFVAYLNKEEGVMGGATGIATALVEGDNNQAIINLSFSNLSSAQNTAYLRIEGDLEVINIGLGQVVGRQWQIRAAHTKLTDQAMLNALYSGQVYITVTTANYPNGEIRGYFNRTSGSSEFVYDPAIHGQAPLGSDLWTVPTGAELSRDIWRFLDQCTFGGTEELHDEVLAAINTAIAGGGTYLDGYRSWLDQQIDPAITPNASLLQLLLAADNEEFVMRGNKPLWASNDPQFGGESYTVSRDSMGFVTSISTSASGTSTGNHPSYHNRRREQWTLALQARAQVRQRMAMALSEITVISDVDGTIQSRHYGAASYWDMLADGAFGKYRHILEKVTLSPMMGIYLSHLRNRAQYLSGGVSIFPDENYAREIMQLFSIGLVLRHPDGALVLDENGLPIPTYDNDDIAELARVLTGFCHGARHESVPVVRFNGLTFNNPSNVRVGSSIEFQGGVNSPGVSFTNFGEGSGDTWFQAPWIFPMKVLGRAGSTIYHDFGAKVLLAGKAGETLIPAQTLPPTGSANDVTTHAMAETDLALAHNMLAGNPNLANYDGHPNTPVNLSRWLIQRFTSSNPSRGYLFRVSEVYRQSNGNLGEVIKAILLDYEARSLQLADSSNVHGRMKEPLVHFMSILRGSKARTGAPLTALRDFQAPFSDNDALTLPGYSKNLPQSELDKYVPGATRFRFPDQTTALGQSPLRAPSVFNWFMPDYTVPGPMAEAGLFAPEMQIASETTLVNRINRLWTFTWMNLAGMNLQPGVDVDDLVQTSTTSAPQVKLSLTDTDTASSYLGSRQLTFTSGNWSTPQVIHVAAVDDNDREGTHTTRILHSASGDAAFSGMSLPSLNVTVQDNDGTGGTVIVTESSDITIVGEHTNAATFSDSYTLRLGSAPSASVVISANANGHLSLSPGTVTFTSANWNTPQTVTVTAINDDIASEQIHIGYIGHAVNSADLAYAGVRAPGITAFVGDNNGSTSNGLSVRHTDGNSTVAEGGASDKFVVALNRAPSANVTVNVGSHSRVNRTPSSLTFTTSNWWVPQVVTVTAVNNTTVDGNVSATLALTSSGGGYSSTANVTINVQDNDGGSLVIAETGGNTTVTEGSPLTSAIRDSYTIRLSKSPATTVTVTAMPERHIRPMSNHAKGMGYYVSDIPSSTSNAQADRVVFDYSDIISQYVTTFTASGGVSGTSTANLNAHFVAVTGLIDRLDQMWCGGQLKAQWPTLSLADLSNPAVINPRKSILAAVLQGYSTSAGSGTPNNIRDRCRIAAYLVSICPQSFTLK